jgi:hypothetical protein
MAVTMHATASSRKWGTPRTTDAWKEARHAQCRDQATSRIARIIVRRGLLFRTETAIPASLVASVGDRVTLRVEADSLKKLEMPNRVTVH